ncbi:hypothetical protein ACJJIE_09995 [Microbulbifer sp. TRSA001]|uniref:hypothetical protein n=1 Tax=Microbulbifer sp. TRSA001 TaxID=3243381 RepID=UPI004039AE2A
MQQANTSTEATFIAPITLTAFKALALCFTLITPVVLWSDTTGSIADYFTYEIPKGQLAYILSKLFGLHSIFLLWLQVCLALANPLASRKIVTRKVHIILGSMVCVTFLLHAGLFIAATSIRTGHSTLGNLIPTFSHGFYKTSVSIGAIAFWALIGSALAGTMRANRKLIAIWLHRLSLPGLILGLLHSILIGTEAGSVMIIATYCLMISSVITLALANYLKYMRGTKPS